MTKIDGAILRRSDAATRPVARAAGDDCKISWQHHEILRYDDSTSHLRRGRRQPCARRRAASGEIRYIGFNGTQDPHIHLVHAHVAESTASCSTTLQMPAERHGRQLPRFGKLVLPEL